MESGSEAGRSLPVGSVAVLGGDAVWPLAQILRSGGVVVLDGEPAPKQVEPALAARYGFGAASVRAGTLGNLRLVAQLLRRAEGQGGPVVWTDADGKPRDALRAGVEPAAESVAEVEANHQAHMSVLRAVLAQASLLVVPLRDVALVEDAGGTLLAAPPPGMTPPKGGKVKAAAKKADADGQAMDEIMAILTRLRPGSQVRLVVLEDGAKAGALRALAAECAARVAGVLYDPLVDALVLRARGEGEPGRYAAALGRVIGLADVLEGLVSASVTASPVAEVAPDKQRDKADKRARKEARAQRKARAGAEARVVCEDELLEAFS